MTQQLTQHHARHVAHWISLALASSLPLGGCTTTAPSTKSEAKAEVKATGLRIENVALTSRDAKTATVTFDIAWENSWRRGSLHDATWVFFKAKTDPKADWQHVRLVADKVINPTGYRQAKDGTPLEFIVPDGKDGFVGMFVRRTAEGSGDLVARQVTAVVDLGSVGGAEKIKGATVLPFGIEMAYVAEGPFFLGGSKGLNAFCTYDGGASNPPPFRVTGGGAIPTGKQDGKLWAKGIVPEDGGEIPAAFPNGYAAFYCMKSPYFTQSLYAGFLNTLTATQAKTFWYRDYQGVVIKRSGETPNFVYAATSPNERCPWLSRGDCMAVSAWAGLRPTTEMEFEKAIRGMQIPPVDRDACLSFFGLTDVNTGELYEREISVGSAAGRKFSGTHGLGTLELPADWPREYRDLVFRGDYAHMLGYQRVGHLCTPGRINALIIHDRRDAPFAGWRSVRTAPKGIAAPVTDRFPTGVVTPVARLAGPVRLDAGPESWGKPLATLEDAADVYPPQNRCVPNEHCQTPWMGPEDASAKVYLSRDNEALYVGAVMTDDKHFNNKAGDEIWDGDAIQFGLVNSKGVHFNLAVALTTNGVAVHQFTGEGDALVKTAEKSVVRDDKTKLTRYGLRIPLAAAGLKAGDEFAFNIMVIDGDDERGMRHYLQLAPGIAYPFRTEFYPRFALKE